MKKTILLLVALWAMLMPKNIYAQESPSIKVNGVASNFEKVIEKITLFTKFDNSSKVDYYLYLLEKRLAELYYVSGSDDKDLIEPTASRYNTYLGITSNFAIANSTTNKKEKIIEVYSRHKNIIKSIQSKYEYESGWWIAIQNDINALDLFTEKVKGI